jgi:hypothetical protein
MISRPDEAQAGECGKASMLRNIPVCLDELFQNYKKTGY